MNNTLLIVEDEETLRESLGRLFSKAGYAVETAGSAEEALEKTSARSFDVVISDILLPGIDGIELLTRLKEAEKGQIFLVMTAFASLDTAVRALRAGAYDYISKPFKEDEVLLSLKKAEERERLKEENLRLQDRIKKIEQRYSFGNIVARSESMAKVFELVSKVADHKTTVLITGESGTGKELIARAIHTNGARASGPMVAINCGGIPENLLESELFGYKKGAFTDAVQDKPGRFKEADEGTLFLDEVGELSLAFQVKLLRVLQEEEITPLGGVGSEKIDVRVIAATSKDLQKEVQGGAFREDLLYRIKVMTIHLPPLRDRRGDIPLLIGYFIDLFNKKLNKKIEGLSSEAMPLLMGYSWPGNIRELENLVERAVLLAKGGLITPSELPSSIISAQSMHPSIAPEHTLSIKKASRRLEEDLIRKALKLTKGNRSKAAKILEVSRPMLLTKIKKFGLEEPK